jgi:hypothetical protein
MRQEKSEFGLTIADSVGNSGLGETSNLDDVSGTAILQLDLAGTLASHDLCAPVKSCVSAEHKPCRWYK